MPPEFFDGHITLKLDIYSLGVIINEMLTGNKATSAEENVRTIAFFLKLIRIGLQMEIG